jgi:hypothetical protein
MTGGHNVFGELVPGDAETLTVTPVRIKKGGKFALTNQIVEYTTGGQIGAPNATGCCSDPRTTNCVANTAGALVCQGGTRAGLDCATPADCPDANGRKSDCPWGDWEHNHHQGVVGDFGSTRDGTSSFSFHSGTASAPPEAFIHSIICGDPGWCVQARCAPDKQIFWEGTGVFHNTKNIDPTSLFGTWVTVGKGKHNPGSIHYYRAHVGDFGEPAGNKQNSSGSCSWNDESGVSISNCALTNPAEIIATEASCTDDSTCGKHGFCVEGKCVAKEPFFSEGGDICSSCADWYEIEIHATTDPASLIIYKVGNFIREGNFQIHPQVGSSCHDAFGTVVQ